METPPKAVRNKALDKILSQLTPVKFPSTPLLRRLGQGTAVNVYQFNRSPQNGQLRSPWALKRVTKLSKESSSGDMFESRIKEEAEILRKLNHPNIVGFRGMLKDVDGKENLAIECCDRSLYDIIESKTEVDDMKPLPAVHIRKVCLDVSKALDYLHNEAKILHGDIKSPNVLIKGDFDICKLCDFGVSLPLNAKNELDLEKNPLAKYVGTDLWSAPEALDEQLISDKCDIFSYGLVIYETIALMAPHIWVLGNSESNEEESNEEESKEEESMEDLHDKLEVLLGTRPPLPQSTEMPDDYHQVIEIFYMCTNELPENRPSAKVLVKALTE